MRYCGWKSLQSEIITPRKTQAAHSYGRKMADYVQGSNFLSRSYCDGYKIGTTLEP